MGGPDMEGSPVTQAPGVPEESQNQKVKVALGPLQSPCVYAFQEGQPALQYPQDPEWRVHPIQPLSLMCRTRIPHAPGHLGLEWGPWRQGT